MTKTYNLHKENKKLKQNHKYNQVNCKIHIFKQLCMCTVICVCVLPSCRRDSCLAFLRATPLHCRVEQLRRTTTTTMACTAIGHCGISRASLTILQYFGGDPHSPLPFPFVFSSFTVCECVSLVSLVEFHEIFFFCHLLYITKIGCNVCLVH